MLRASRRGLGRAFRVTLPVLAGYLVMGMGFGILLSHAGFGVGYAGFMALFLYAGSMQYLMVDLLAEGASLLAVAVATLAVQARHLFYGISMIERYRGAGFRKPYLIYSITDETYSLHLTEPPEHPHLFRISLLDHCYWILGCVLGALVGDLLPFELQGLDFSLTALFVAIFVEQWRTAGGHLPAILGILSSVAMLLLFGDSFLIPAMLLILLLVILFRGRIEGVKKEKGGVPRA